MQGWTVDQDTPTSPTVIHAYVTGPSGARTGPYVFSANRSRPDVAAAYPYFGALHGFNGSTIYGLQTGNNRVDVYALDTSNAANDYTWIGARPVSVS